MLNHELLKLDGKTMLFINAPIMHKGKVSIGEFKKVIKSIKFVETKIELLKNIPPFVKGWMTWTMNENDHIKKVIKRLGANEYKVLDDRTWFSKECV